MEEKGKLAVTYETIFEMVRREKNRDELQKMEPTFFHDIESYVAEKMSALQVAQTTLTVFADEERAKLQKQLENVKTLIKELYERRERKILNMALIRSRTQSTIVDTSALLEEEKAFFTSLCTTLSNQRDQVCHRLLAKQIPAQAPAEKPSLPHHSPEQKPKLGKISVSFLHYVPKFIGRELEEYGPYEPGQTVQFPREIGLVLIAKGRARENSEAVQ